MNTVYSKYNRSDEYVFKRVKSNVDIEALLNRGFDIVFSIFAIVIFSPIMLIIALLIKLNSPDGPIFFKHVRLGLNGKTFKVYKFRTMVVNAEEKLQEMLDKNPELKEEYEKDFKLKNDPRIIPNIGNFLRKSSLDELPQFFNSLFGDLSIVGPRPIVKNEVLKYGNYAAKLYTVKPGITGLWQVSGRNDIDYSERVALDMKYIDTKSLWLNIKIIFKTVEVMVLRKGA